MHVRSKQAGKIEGLQESGIVTMQLLQVKVQC